MLSHCVQPPKGRGFRVPASSLTGWGWEPEEWVQGWGLGEL